MKRKIDQIIQVVVKFFIYLYCLVVYRVKVEGTENIPKEGAVIFCGNHRNLLDPPLMEVTCKRNTRFMAKEELSKNKFLAFLGNVFDAIYVKRDSKDITALKESLKTLKNGGSIALFPEGTRNGIQKGEQVKEGAAFLAIRTGSKVVPVGISGGLKPFQKAKIVYGKPLDFSKEKMTKENEKEVLQKVTNEIMSEILKLIQ